MNRLLFLSAKVGAGHDSAAKSIIELVNKEEFAETLLIDSYSYANTILGNLFANIYLNIINYTPTLYKKIYENGKNKNTTVANFRKNITNLSHKKFIQLYQNFKPDMVIATHSFSAGISSLLKQYYPNISVLTIITDFSVHPFWIYKNIDLYAVANEEIKQELIKNGIPEDRIYITGIPVHTNFYTKKTKREFKRELSLLEDIPLLLVMGGGNGLINIKNIINILNKVKYDFQVVFITGKNKRLYNNLINTKFLNPYIKLIKVISYTDYVYKYMKASEVLISKPGGLTSAEALASQVPILITNPIPGHEEKNMQYLIKKGYAFLLDSEKTIENILSHKIILKNNYHEIKKSSYLILKLIKETLRLKDKENKKLVYQSI